jgi:hypothetical protein
VEKVVRGYEQRRSTGAGLFEMPEIARSLFRQRRRSLLLNGSGKVEELFKHDCVPLFMEAQPWLQGAVKKIMLRRSRSIIHSKAPAATAAT